MLYHKIRGGFQPFRGRGGIDINYELNYTNSPTPTPNCCQNIMAHGHIHRTEGTHPSKFGQEEAYKSPTYGPNICIIFI